MTHADFLNVLNCYEANDLAEILLARPATLLTALDKAGGSTSFNTCCPV